MKSNKANSEIRPGSVVRGVRIEGYSSEGLGIAHLSDGEEKGRVVFVSGAPENSGCPIGICRGDVCDLVVVGEKHGVLHARIKNITEPSSFRVDNDCPVYPVCGGCAFRHISYREELWAKAKRVKDALSHIGGVNLEPEEVIASPATEAYRNKASYHVTFEEGEAVTGVYRSRSHDIVPVSRCLLQHKKTDLLAAALRGYISRTGRDDIIGLIVRISWEEKALVVIESTGKAPQDSSELINTLKNAVEGLSGIVWIRHLPKGEEEVRHIWGEDFLTERILGLNFRISYDAFAQVNLPMAEIIYKKALDYAGDISDRIVADLYCGSGIIALLMSQKAELSVGIEINRHSVKDARRNARANGIFNAEFICADVSAAMREVMAAEIKPAVITVDPPRRGLAPGVAASIAEAKPERIIYISCDPATLARDVKAFKPLGYTLKQYAVADLFPRTANVETVALLERING